MCDYVLNVKILTLNKWNFYLISIHYYFCNNLLLINLRFVLYLFNQEWINFYIWSNLSFILLSNGFTLSNSWGELIIFLFRIVQLYKFILLPMFFDRHLSMNWLLDNSLISLQFCLLIILTQWIFILHFIFIVRYFSDKERFWQIVLFVVWKRLFSSWWILWNYL